MFPVGCKVFAKKRITNDGGDGDPNEDSKTARGLICAEFGETGEVLADLEDGLSILNAQHAHTRYLVYFERSGATIPTDASDITAWTGYESAPGLHVLSFDATSVSVIASPDGWMIVSSLMSEDLSGSRSESHADEAGKVVYYDTLAEAQAHAEPIAIGEAYLGEEHRLKVTAEHQALNARQVRLQELLDVKRAELALEEAAGELLRVQLQNARMRKELAELLASEKKN